MLDMMFPGDYILNSYLGNGVVIEVIIRHSISGLYYYSIDFKDYGLRVVRVVRIDGHEVKTPTHIELKYGKCSVSKKMPDQVASFSTTCKILQKSPLHIAVECLELGSTPLKQECTSPKCTKHIKCIKILRLARRIKEHRDKEYIVRIKKERAEQERIVRIEQERIEEERLNIKKMENEKSLGKYHFPTIADILLNEYEELWQADQNSKKALQQLELHERKLSIEKQIEILKQDLRDQDMNHEGYIARALINQELNLKRNELSNIRQARSNPGTADHVETKPKISQLFATIDRTSDEICMYLTGHNLRVAYPCVLQTKGYYISILNNSVSAYIRIGDKFNDGIVISINGSQPLTDDKAITYAQAAEQVRKQEQEAREQRQQAERERSERERQQAERERHEQEQEQLARVRHEQLKRQEAQSKRLQQEKVREQEHLQRLAELKRSQEQAGAERQQQLREQQLREQQLREQQLREQQLREQQLREQQLREQQLREQQLREQQLREQEQARQSLKAEQAERQRKKGLSAEFAERERLRASLKFFDRAKFSLQQYSIESTRKSVVTLEEARQMYFALDRSRTTDILFDVKQNVLLQRCRVSKKVIEQEDSLNAGSGAGMGGVAGGGAGFMIGGPLGAIVGAAIGTVFGGMVASHTNPILTQWDTLIHEIAALSV